MGTFLDPVLGQTTLILRWNGTRWTHVVTPATDDGELLAVTGTSAASSWAVGDVRDPTSQAVPGAGPALLLTGPAVCADFIVDRGTCHCT